LHLLDERGGIAFNTVEFITQGTDGAGVQVVIYFFQDTAVKTDVAVELLTGVSPWPPGTVSL
jgi:hypothetical protein